MSDLNELRKKVTNGKSLWISRVPEKTKARFIELANDQFVGDYGFLIKYLIDFHDGTMPTGHEAIEVLLEDLHDRVTKLEQKEEKTEDKKLSFKERREKLLAEQEAKK